MKHTNEQINKANEMKYDVTNWERFRSCNAYISNAVNHRYRLIKSYNTIVGLADADEGKVYEFGKYSRTTSKQFTQICNTFFRSFERVYIEETNWY